MSETRFEEMLINNLKEENKELKQQLEEKEKERHEEWKIGKEWKWEWQKANYKLEKADQDKISFAVEQLEKVKEKANEKQELDWGMGFRYKDYWDIVAEIDNQIKQLKEMK